jgi:hypothetical protein
MVDWAARLLLSFYMVCLLGRGLWGRLVLLGRYL